MEILIPFLLCALGLFIYLTHKNNEEVIRLKEKLYEKENSSTRKFVSVAFKKSDTQLYDYFIVDNDLKIGDLVEVPFHNKITGTNEVKVATVKYISQVGEQSNYARSYVLGKVGVQSQTEKRFVNVIFEKDAPKSYSYLIGDFEVKVGDFVVVHTSDNAGNVRLRTAQIIYISSPGETSPYAKTEIFKKARKNKW